MTRPWPPSRVERASPTCLRTALTHTSPAEATTRSRATQLANVAKFENTATARDAGGCPAQDFVVISAVGSAPKGIDTDTIPSCVYDGAMLLQVRSVIAEPVNKARNLKATSKARASRSRRCPDGETRRPVVWHYVYHVLALQ